ncbi:universal stress protein [Isachenkonia alkalipeptolytica]|uniref:Universal stress protein n=1 Tax=Isachenkonia alkalipeptolytica TaxID=2565777 RepID=A0AA44BDZ4_9CLOT|nr:universal stress protein [Isachenkonia alkalipeptolytica]NBG88467.1 universal stress protein [Isachenkonia alkalipeptolytica]
MKILVCYDGSEASQRAIDKAHQLTTDCGIHEVTLLHAYEDYSWVATSADGYAPSPENLSKLRDLEAKKVEEKKEFLFTEGKKFEDTNATLEVKLVQGHPASVITEVAEEGEYDLIIMGSRGLGGLKRVVLGSVSNSVIQGTNISVMVVK